MHLKQPKDIVSLVLSLTLRERRYFKKNFDSGSEFVQLFDYIIKYKSFAVSEFNLYLAKKQNRDELYTSGYISTLRQYLRDKLLESLKKLHANANPTMKVWNDLSISQILVNKGLIRMARQEFESSYKLRNELFPLESLILQRHENHLQFSTGFAGLTMDNIFELYEERRLKAQQHLVEIELARVVSVLSYCLQKNVTDNEKIEIVEKQQVLQMSPDELCFTNRYLLQWAQAQLSLLKGEYGEAFTKFSKVILGWLERPQMIENYPDVFMGCCLYYFKFFQFRFSGNFDEDDLDYINNLIHMLRKAGAEIGYEERMEFYVFYFEIIKQFALQDYEKVIGFEKRVNEILFREHSTLGVTKVFFYYLIALSYYRTGRLRQCAEKLSEIIYDKNCADENPLFFAKSNLLFLMCHYDLGNERFVELERKKRERFLEKISLMKPVEKEFFSFLHQIFLKRNSDRHFELVKEFTETISRLFEDPTVAVGYRDLPLFDWLKGIAGRKEKEQVPG